MKTTCFLHTFVLLIFHSMINYWILRDTVCERLPYVSSNDFFKTFAFTFTIIYSSLFISGKKLFLLFLKPDTVYVLDPPPTSPKNYHYFATTTCIGKDD